MHMFHNYNECLIVTGGIGIAHLAQLHNLKDGQRIQAKGNTLYMYDSSVFLEHDTFSWTAVCDVNLFDIISRERQISLYWHQFLMC